METITRSDSFFRRLPPAKVRPDGSVLPTAYMKDDQPDPQISVNLANRSSAQATADGGPWLGFGAGELPAAVPIDMALAVRHDPEPDNDAHSVIEGVASLRECQQLAAATAVLVTPDRQVYVAGQAASKAGSGSSL